MNVEPGQPGYILNRNEAQISIKEEIKTGTINFKDFEIQVRDQLKKAGYKPPNQQRERTKDDDELLQPSINEKDLSVAINIDLKLFIQRFYEFVHMTKNVEEIHDFVQKLMKSDYLTDRDSKIQFIKNMLLCFQGLEGIDDELIMISILDIILNRLIPQDDDEILHSSLSLRKQKIALRQNNRLKQELKEWQDVMFDSGVPQLLISFIDADNDLYLAIRSIQLLNSMLLKSTEEKQQRFLDVL